MNPDYLLACAIVWRRTADPEAGVGLLEGLDSSDPRLRALSRALLIDGEENSMLLLEGALSAGIVNPEAASACIADILQNRRARPKGTGAEKRRWSDQLLC